MDEIPEAELIAGYYARRDHRAFEELVRRHGPMVMATVRRLLSTEADADDAFQATFFALAKSRIRKRAAVGAWLHETAIRCAQSVRRQNHRWEHKVKWNTRRMMENEAELEVDDTMAILHDEIARLPNRYRIAVILCDLEGLTRQQASARLGIPVRTVSAHVSRGRELLSNRLVKRGIGMSAFALMAHVATAAKAAAGQCNSLTADVAHQAMLFAEGCQGLAVSNTVVRAANEVIRRMATTKLVVCGVATVAMLLTSALSYAVGDQFTSADGSIVLADTFDGTSSPNQWTPIPGYDSGTFDTSTGDLVITTLDGKPQVTVLDHTFYDVSIRARVRASHQDMDGACLMARVTIDDRRGYAAGVSPFTGNAFIQQNLPTPNVLTMRATDLDQSVEDLWLQFDVIGDQLSLYVWRPGEPKPEEPFLRTIDDRFHSGLVGVLVDTPTDDQPRSGIVRSIVVADQPIGEEQCSLALAKQ